MPRVKRGVNHVKKRKKLLAKVKGYKWGRKNLISIAKTAVLKAGAHAFMDRRKRNELAEVFGKLKSVLLLKSMVSIIHVSLML